MADPDFQISVDIAAPPETVWAVMYDVERWHEWTQSIRSIRLLNRGPLAIGSRALIRQPRFPPAVWKVVALEPGRHFTWDNGFPGLWVSAHHSVSEIPDGTRASMQLHYAGFLGRLLARRTRDITNRYLGYEAAGLKRRSESVAGKETTR